MGRKRKRPTKNVRIDSDIATDIARAAKLAKRSFPDQQRITYLKMKRLGLI